MGLQRSRTSFEPRLKPSTTFPSSLYGPIGLSCRVSGMRTAATVASRSPEVRRAVLAASAVARRPRRSLIHCVPTMKALAGRAAAGTAVVAAAGAAHTLWLRGTFTSRLEAATQAQAGQVPACVLSGGDVSTAALDVKRRLEHGASVVVLSGSGRAETAAALAADPSLAALRVHLRGSLRRALDECHLPPAPTSALAAAIARLEGRGSLDAALEVAAAANERGGLLLCLSQEQLMEVRLPHA